MSKKTSHNLPEAFAKNLMQLLSHEKKRELAVPLHLRMVNPAIQAFGSVWFLCLNIIVFILWIATNIGFVPGARIFDKYPFEFLTLSVSLEAIVLSVIVLIAQNKLQRDSGERSLLDLHINLLAESEATLMLKKLDRIEKHLGIQTHPIKIISGLM